MKGTSVFIVAAVTLLVAPAVDAAVESLTDVIPAGSPLVFFVADVATSLEKWRESPSARLWNDPQIKGFLAPLREELEVDRWDEIVREETGHDLDEIVAMFTGDAAVFIDDIEFEFTSGEEDADVSIALVATVGDKADALEEMLLEVERRSEEEADDVDGEDGDDVVYETREFRGVELHLETIYEDDEVTWEAGWAVVDGVLVDAYPVETLERIVDSVLDGGVDEPIHASDNFASITRYTRDADSWLFADMDTWSPVITELFEIGAKEARESDNPVPFEPAALVDALGIEAWQAVFLTSTQDGNVAAATFGVTYTENKGLVKLLAYGPDSAPRPSFIPRGSDAFSASSFDFSEAWSAVVDIVNSINPALMAMASMQLQSTAQQAGVELDLKRDLLDNLDGELISIQNFHHATGDDSAELDIAQDQVIALGFQQRTGIENAIENLKSIAGRGSDLFSTREFAGRTIYTLASSQAEQEGPANELSYVVTDSHLLISLGTPETLEDTLLTIDGKGESVWEQGEIRKALTVLPERSMLIQVQDLSVFGAVIFPLIATLDANGLGGGNGSAFRICDPEALPDADIIGAYLSSAVTGLWKDDRSMVFTTWSLPADAE